MKVVALVGSPRPIGNTSLLVQEVLKGAADTKVYYLNPLNIKGCQSVWGVKAIQPALLMMGNKY